MAVGRRLSIPWQPHHHERCACFSQGKLRWSILGGGGSTRVLASRGRKLPALPFEALSWQRPGWTVLQRHGVQLSDSMEVRHSAFGT